jgi:hypothetical protein
MGQKSPPEHADAILRGKPFTWRAQTVEPTNGAPVHPIEGKGNGTFR